jgi:hypothetical protein
MIALEVGLEGYALPVVRKAPVARLVRKWD